MKNFLRFIAALLGAVSVLLGLGVPIGLLSLCYEGCIDTSQRHWFFNIAALAFIALALCVSCFILSAALFFYARYGALRIDKGRRSPAK